VLLDDKNYNMWARQVSFGLIGRDKLEYINGEFTMLVPTIMGELTEDAKRAIKEWRKSDNRVAAWLLATMEPHISKNHDIPRNNQANVGQSREVIWQKKKSLSCLSASTRTSLNQATTQSICL
jgi:hypothetical protein